MKASRDLGRIGCAIIFTALGASSALAAPGDHIQVGEVEVVPSVDLGTGWTSNIYKEEVAPTSGLAVTIGPALSASLTKPELVMGLSAGWNIKKWVTAKGAVDPSNVDDFTTSNLGASFDILPGSMVGGLISENFSVSNRASEAKWAGTNALIRHLNSQTQAAISIHPGESLRVDVGGHLGYDSYDGNPEANPDGDGFINSKVSLGPDISAKWTFFPRTRSSRKLV